MSEITGTKRPAATAWLLAARGLVIVALTFPPQVLPSVVKVGFWSIACGSRGTADAFFNWLACVPGGYLAALLMGPARAAVALAGSSALIEARQTAIPGRHPALSDLLFNGGGALTGALLTFPGAFRRATRLLGPAAALAWLAPLVLMVPVTPREELWSQWEPVSGGMGVFGGAVVSARLGEQDIPSWEMTDSAVQAFASNEDLEVAFEAGATPEGLAPIFAIADRRTERWLILAAEGPALAFYRRALASALRLEQPFVWLPGALAGIPDGSRVVLKVSRTDEGTCIEVGGTTDCSVTPGLERGWQLLWGSRRNPAQGAGVISLVWCLVLGAMLGIGCDSRLRALALSVTLAALGVALAWWSPYVELSPTWGVPLVLAAVAGARTTLLRSVAPPTVRSGAPRRRVDA
ncbi:MAG: hypothetical protein FIA95_16215 [Gemmatimonadetes bacterium]|nr:hypothetical protein [Gemmatimonadota bacterium]